MGERKIQRTKYNERYKEIETNGRVPEERKLREREKRRCMFKLRCGNLEEDNKYWVEEHRKKCIFCGKGKDNLKHYTEECSEIRKVY